MLAIRIPIAHDTITPYSCFESIAVVGSRLGTIRFRGTGASFERVPPEGDPRVAVYGEHFVPSRLNFSFAFFFFFRRPLIVEQCRLENGVVLVFSWICSRLPPFRGTSFIANVYRVYLRTLRSALESLTTTTLLVHGPRPLGYPR